MALFNNIKYEIIWNMWTGDGIWQKKSTTGQSWICILHDKNTDEYFLHGYQLYYGEDKKNPTLRIMRDFVKPINKEMFAGGNYTIVRFQHQNYLLVANHLTSSMRTPKPIIKQWCDPLMTFHKHCSCYSLLTLR